MKQHFLYVVLVAVIAFAPCAWTQANVSFTPDGFLLIDGQPRLILGLYECPADDAVLADVAANGVNLVCAGADAAVLDRVQKHGLRGWIPLGGALALPEGDDAAKGRLIETVNKFKEHPALLCWEAPDESLWMEWFACYKWLTQDQPQQLGELITKAAANHTQEEIAGYVKMLEKAADYSFRSMWKESEVLYDKIWTDLGQGNPHPELHATARIKSAERLGNELTRGWEAVQAHDPKHACWQNHAPCNSVADLRHYNRGVHAAGCDIYPAPANSGVMHGNSLPDLELTSVGAFTEQMRNGAPGKACWMVLQGFGWADLKDDFNPQDAVHGRRPTFQETRFMAYDSLLHGANAILYWGTSAIPKDSQLWRDILKTIKELRALEPAIVGIKPPAQPVVLAETNYTCFEGGDPKLILRQAGEDWVLIAVNEQRAGIAFDVRGLPLALNGKTLYRLYSDEEHVVQDGGFHDGILKLDVQVYATSRKFEAK